jgi:uncharacterized SAM-binding protein YcdF (DUF218 family)
MLITQDILNNAQKIWNYHCIYDELKPANVIFVLGSHDTRVAQRGAELFLEKYASLILFSGGLGNLTTGIWHETEADKFARIATDMGIPESKILIENKSSNTGENIQFSYKLLEEKNIQVKSMILVQKPYMQRRTYATFMKQWPGEEIEIMVTAPLFDFLNYANEEIPMEKVINIMVGDLQRIIEYPAKGFQIYQEVPADVLESYEFLIKAGFTSHLIQD